MATYVLVHGAWGSANHWSPIARRLRAAGHEVHVVGLTGLGARSHLLSPAITLSTHIADVTGVIDDERLKNIILVGHSYGGMVITGAAAARPSNIRTLVYVDAFVPREGEALWDIADEPSRRHYIDAQRDMPGLVAPFPGSPPGLTRHPLLTLTEPVGAAGSGTWFNTYVYATRDAPTVFTKFHDRLCHDPAWHVHVVDCGHGVMQEREQELYDILIGEAERVV